MEDVCNALISHDEFKAWSRKHGSNDKPRQTGLALDTPYSALISGHSTVSWRLVVIAVL